MATISKNIMHRTAEFVAGRQLKSGGMNSELVTNYRSVLDNVFRLYNKAGFDVKYLEADKRQIVCPTVLRLGESTNQHGS